ncbi:hypothetical protein CHGG_01607 [Chaetomium globosum CBS 148.51]|uniref:Amine oxidase domain-containing protein n=1 Tax=Chaetomium globosum (strain ATCC 6205 / CBS 148.51 / DSM 1962 / NBRC 6347 / NRRL 1970) TaxID=306901 RepID=Q2HDU7_CHAGB|nr:uncharacterized protein CHGG_01607 [Chaetomium globosum CBS 148.51]EAQ93372.1 hypothetical protein CHGG_01607 [Chaetomium globosum CBS 148.51]
MDTWHGQVCCRHGYLEVRQPTRHYAVGNPHNPPKSIAILGGGLTGLSTAWYLTRFLPEAKITIYEAQTRVGGWIQTDKVEVKTPDGTVGTVHFERAARMITPQTGVSRVAKWDDLVFFDLVTELGLTNQLMHLNKADEPLPAYIYYPDRLVALPKPPKSMLRYVFGSLNSFINVIRMLTEPLFRGLIPGMLNVIRTKRNNPYEKDLFEGRSDMSMSMSSGFLSDYLVPTEGQPISHAVVRSVDWDMVPQLLKNKAVFDLASRHLGAGALWFRDGFTTLPEALAAALGKNPNVTIKTGTPVHLVDYNKSKDQVAIHTENTTSEPAMYDKVVSTIFAKTLAEITQDQLPSLSYSTAVNIMVVNIWYPVPQANFPHNGFGYLVPQLLPFEQNPECILGAIFDSDRESPLPTASNPDPAYRGADTVPGTKVTVMMGGHYWDGWPSSAIPDTERAKESALAAIARHLKLPAELSQQAHASAKFCRECIPQHLVGHAARMRGAHLELEWAFKGRLAVAGQSYQNPGAMTTLRAGRDVARQIAGREDEEAGEWAIGDTGLRRFELSHRQLQYMSIPRQILPLRYGSGAYVDEDGKARTKDGLTIPDLIQQAKSKGS